VSSPAGRDVLVVGESLVDVVLDDLLGAPRRAALHAIDRRALWDVVTFAAACAAVTVGREGADPPRREDVACGSRPTTPSANQNTDREVVPCP
jgi:fructokinase